MSKIKQSTEIATNRYKAKPIFAEEKKFIESRLPQIAPLPDACWIYGGNTKNCLGGFIFFTIFTEI